MKTPNWTTFEEPILDLVEAYLTKPDEKVWNRLLANVRRCIITWIVRDEDYNRVYNPIHEMLESVRNETPYQAWEIIRMARACYLAGAKKKRR